MPLLGVGVVYGVQQEQNFFPLKKNPVACSETALQSKSICSKCFDQGICFQAAVLFSTKVQMYTQSLTIFCRTESTCYRMFQFVSYILIGILESFFR